MGLLPSRSPIFIVVAATSEPKLQTTRLLILLLLCLLAARSTITNFRSTAKGFRKTYTATATNQNASSVFGDDYGVNYPKEIVINSGVELGATGTGEEALQINSGLSGSMTITNNGTLSGAGGSANGGAGGDAFEANVACTLINNGTIRAGGGGGGRGGSGGRGGNGGQGRTSTSGPGSWTGWTLDANSSQQKYIHWGGPGYYKSFWWNSSRLYLGYSNVYQINHGGYTYQAQSVPKQVLHLLDDARRV